MQARAYMDEIFCSYQGEGALVGQRHLFLRFSGCNIRCSYCDTPAALLRSEVCRVQYPDGSSCELANPLSFHHLSEVVAKCIEADPAVAMLAITGGEPLLQAAFLASWLGSNPASRPCLLETNALLPEAYRQVAGHFAVVSADFKLPSNSGEDGLWERHREFLQACCEADIADIYVKMPVDAATDTEEVRRAARIVMESVPSATLYIQPLSDEKTGRWRIEQAQLQDLARVAAAELPDTRILPQVHKLMGIA